MEDEELMKELAEIDTIVLRKLDDLNIDDERIKTAIRNESKALDDWLVKETAEATVEKNEHSITLRKPLFCIHYDQNAFASSPQEYLRNLLFEEAVHNHSLDRANVLIKDMHAGLYNSRLESDISQKMPKTSTILKYILRRIFLQPSGKEKLENFGNKYRKTSMDCSILCEAAKSGRSLIEEKAQAMPSLVERSGKLYEIMLRESKGIESKYRNLSGLYTGLSNLMTSH